MSTLQDVVDENEIGYQYAILDIKNAISNYGIDIVLEAIDSYVNDNVNLDLTNIYIPDTITFQ
jgi:hypothetical protein